MTTGMREVAPIEIFKLHAALHLEFLDEMTVPVQSGFKSSQRTRPAAPVLSLFQRVVRLAQTQIAPRQIG